MSRWRPPRPKSSPYITPEGFQYLEQELRSLWEKRKEVVVALSAAAAEGDRSENAEYISTEKKNYAALMAEFIFYKNVCLL